MATAAEPAAEPAAESINFDHIFAKFDVNKDGRAPQRLKRRCATASRAFAIVTRWLACARA